MKILQFPAYITINGSKEFSRSTTGYGYMAIDIATSIAQQSIEVDLLTQSNITKGLQYKGVNILKRTWGAIFLNLKFAHIVAGLKIIINERIVLKRIPYILFYNISMGYFEKILETKEYDVVHIHGIGYYTTPIIETCKKKNIKYLVTLHGLNSFTNSINITNKEKQIEKEFIRKAEANQIPVTVISSGIKKVIINYLDVLDSKTFSVITNGCETKINNNIYHMNIRETYNIKTDAKIMLCIGNIGINKNQIQIVRSFSRLSENDIKRLVILFLGTDMTNGNFSKVIKKSGLNSSLIYCGNIPKDDVAAYYKQADYNIVASISEGFGLSIIEGFVYGLPCLTFHNLDAVPDLYSENSMLLISERTDEALANGISQILNMEFDKKDIQMHAQQFSLEQMGEKYVDFYRAMLCFSKT